MKLNSSKFQYIVCVCVCVGGGWVSLFSLQWVNSPSYLLGSITQSVVLLTADPGVISLNPSSTIFFAEIACEFLWSYLEHCMRPMPGHSNS